MATLCFISKIFFNILEGKTYSALHAESGPQTEICILNTAQTFLGIKLLILGYLLLCLIGHKPILVNILESSATRQNIQYSHGVYRNLHYKTLSKSE